MNRSFATRRFVCRWSLFVGAFLSSAGWPGAGVLSAPLHQQTPRSDDSVTLYQLPAGSRPHVLTVGPDGAVWFSIAGGRCVQGTGNKIGRIASDGRVTEHVLPTANSYPGAIVGPDGALWFGERAASKIGRMALDGHVTEYIVPTAVAATFKDGFLPDVECALNTSSPAEARSSQVRTMPSGSLKGLVTQSAGLLRMDT